jgi:hypothetical protein
MNFRTEVEPIISVQKIGLYSKIVTIGSCFSEVLGTYLNQNKIDCLNNPFGVVYNTKSLSNLVFSALNGHAPSNEKFIFEDDMYFHYDFHSSFRASSKTELTSLIETQQAAFKENIRKADYLVITLGTSWVYENKETQEIVSNCHKKPGVLFNKKLLSLEHQIKLFRHLYNNLKEVNSRLRIIVTISPVRHLKDTLELNSVSKSILRVLVHEIISEFTNISYFPSFEIMNDDLRDYRFYKADLIHPNEIAEEYIIEKFCETYFDTNLLEFLQDWQKIKLAMQHRPFNPKSSKHQLFIKNSIEKLKVISRKVEVKNELEILESQLI